MGDHRERGAVTASRLRERFVSVLTTLVRWVGTLAAVLLVAHVVLTVGGANPDNGITRFVAAWADPLALGFRDLFTPTDANLGVLVNHGLAALFWLVASALVSRLIRRGAP
ncbi:hypothetical protein GCM10012275_55400 [Longimycelium tulufanense]|uniref:YGGT family protein n=1 Tax=Longimycelium tulufanense TaxID=907463 RepID=A0A8J3CDE2_9PSEU|nr:hypothetical protein [Longimycelium tulufanense]GGM77632.1 hypothetical protein GCM10012275_55400 [Longimycelium tulufanense]